MKKARLLRRLLCLLFLLLLPFWGGFAASAEDGTATEPEVPDAYRDYLDSLPDELLALLPDGLFSTDGETLGSAVSEMSDASYLLRTLLSIVGLKLTDAAALLAEICGLILLAAVARSLKTSMKSEGVSRAFSFCATAVITLCLISKSYVGLSSVGGYFETLAKMTSAALPLMGALYAMGGNVAAAVASAAGLTAFLSLLEQFIAKSILPFCGFCMATAFAQGIEPRLRMGTLLSTVKKNYTTVLSFLMMLLIAMLSSQTLIAARQDTVAMKSMKFAAGNWIPMVGGSVGELFRTVSSGVGYLRTAVGFSGILLLLLALMPTLIELFLARFVWQIAASFADLLGCDGEKKLLDEFASLLGYLIAAVSIASSVLVIAFSLLIHCASAIGG